MAKKKSKSPSKKAAKKAAKKKPAKKTTAKKTLTKVSTASATYDKYEVIRIVLDVAGKNGIDEKDPEIPPLSLDENLDYDQTVRDILETELDNYVKSIDEDASFNAADMAACDTVQDVVDNVEEKLDI